MIFAGADIVRPHPTVGADIIHGLLILTAGPGLRLLPPLTITREEMDRGLTIMKETLS